MDSKKNETIKKLFEYRDFKLFLEDFIAENNKKFDWYSKRYFAKLAGFKSHSHINYILSGKRNATEESISKILSALKLDADEEQFFVNLVKFNQAKNDRDRSKYQLNLSSLKEKLEYRKLDKSMVEFYSKTYHAVVRELVVYSDWNGNYEKLAKYVQPQISTKEAEDSVKLLIGLELVKKENEKYFLNSPAVESGDIPLYYLKKARKDMILASVDAAENNSPKERFYNNLTVSVDEKRYEVIRKLTEEYIENIENAVMFQEDEDLQRVYQFNIQMFPLSRVFKDED